MSEQRKLAAILVADIVGFSRMASVDEDATLARLRALRSDLIDPTIAVHNGRIVKRTGDGSLVEFRSVVDAVRCAVEVQTSMAERNAGLPPEKRIEFRIGIHLGDVVVEGDGDLMGDGVNIAARLEGLAAPGTICLSEDAYRQVRARLSHEITDMGERTLKNIAEPMRVYAVRPGPEAPARPAAAPTGPAMPDKPSVAVLPFENMSGDADQDYFADGMVEDIITGLSRIKWIFVIARNTTFSYKGMSPNVAQVGRDLGVRYVLEGSVRRAADRLRVTAQLIEAETGHHVWADRYDRTLEDVFELQDELTMSVVAAIEPSLRKAEIERVRRVRPDSLHAYDLALQAFPLIYPAMPDGARRGIALLERALEQEPDYALAHGFLAWAHEITFARGGGAEENRLGAVRHAQEAIAYGRDDATALALGGFVMGMIAHDRGMARQAFESALAVSPSCALAYNLGSVVMLFGGDVERGSDWAEQAVRLSPLDPMNYAPHLVLSLAHLARGEDGPARDAAYRVVRENPYWSSGHFMLAATHARQGETEKARASAARVLELEPEFTIGRLRAIFDIQPNVMDPLADALRLAGLPD